MNGGFNEGHRTWQCINPNYKEINIEKDLKAEKSVYRYYQKLLAIKSNDETAIYGRTREYDHENKKIIAYSREYNGHKLFVVGNFSKKTVSYQLPEWIRSKVLINNYDNLKQNEQTVELKPYQAVVYSVDE